MNGLKGSFCFAVLALTVLVGPVDAREPLRFSAPPSIWVYKTDDRLVGPVVDLLRSIYGQLGIRVQSELLPWARAIENVKSGELDLIPVIFRTDERARYMLFSESYATVPTSVFTPAGKTFRFNSLKDLVGKRGVVMRGDSISEDFKRFRWNLNLQEITSYFQMINMLAENRADYAVAAQYGFIVQAKKMNKHGLIAILDTPIASRDLHFAVSKKSRYSKYLSAVNAELMRRKKDGSLEALVKATINEAAKR